MEDRCVCCGEIVPEGRMVCPNCLLTVKEGEEDGLYQLQEQRQKPV